MFLAVVLAIVGGGSYVAARTTLQHVGHRQLIGTTPGARVPSKRAPRTALLTAVLTVAIFVPLLFVTYEVLALAEHALGR